MTVQEAIEILRDTPIDIRSTREDDIHTLYATAQGMAIEALSCSAFPNRSEPKTAESGSVEKEIPEIKADRTTSGDLISRQDFDKFLEDAEKEAVKNCKYVFASALNTIRGNLRIFPSAQPELIEKTAYIRGFEQGRTQGMIDAQGEKK